MPPGVSVLPSGPSTRRIPGWQLPNPFVRKADWYNREVCPPMQSSKQSTRKTQYNNIADPVLEGQR